MLVMESCPDPTAITNDLQEFLIPSIELGAFKHMQFTKVVPLILEANLGTEITYSEIQRLYGGTLHGTTNLRTQI